MREIKECTAEVFHRSEKRIKERKQNRNRILMYCIPLLVCLTVFSATILPAMMPVGSDNAAEHTGIVDSNDSMGSISGSYVKIEIQDVSDFSKYFQSITSKDEVADLYDTIQSVWSSGSESYPNASGGDDEPKDYNNTSETDTNTKGTVYEITFSNAQGKKVSYLLAGNVLTNEITSEKLCLTSDQALELREAFNLPE